AGDFNLARRRRLASPGKYRFWLRTDGGIRGNALSPDRRELITARQHSAEVAAAEQVHMKMRHLLMGRHSGIGEDAIAALGHSLFPGDLADGADQRGNLLRRGVLREIVERDVFALGYRQH